MKLLRAAVLAVCLLGCEMIVAGGTDTTVNPSQSSVSTNPSTDQSSPSSSPSVVTDSTSSSDSPPIEGQSSISSDATSLASQPTGTGSTPPATSEPSGGSSAAALTQTTTPTPLPTIAMQTQKFPNDVTVHSDKAVMQKAIILSNHISALSAQIIALNSTLDPNNSVLIQSLQNMYMNATQMNKILANQTEQLGIANDKLKTQEAIYANTSRVMFCMTNTCLPTTLAPTTTAPFTGTTPPPQCISCNCSITASASDSTFTFNATTATVCSTTVSATGGTVNYTLTAASIPPEAKINVVDVGSGVTLKSYLADKTSDTAYVTNSTNLRFDAIPANAITYTITYSVSNPCDSYCGTNTKCTTNSQGQPICSCSQTGGCNSMSGKDCIVIDPCNNKNKNTCKNSNPPGTCKPSSDPNTCTFTCDSSSPLFLNFPEEEREVREKRGFFQRWIF